MTNAKLPGILIPRATHLERFGATADGGYLIDPRDVAACDGLISMGIALDWSFEKQFVLRKPVPVRAYDGSLSAWYVVARAARDLLYLKPWRTTSESIRLAIDYLRFFSGPVRHVQKYVGTLHSTYRETSAGSITLDDAFRELQDAGSRKPFLKVDIEGSEYSILGDIIRRADSTAGLAIEFHDCGQHLDEITAFVANYSLPLVHIHANNYSPVDGRGCPSALELSFSASPQTEARRSVLPHPLDHPNDVKSPEILISFAQA
jgi:hypothetical protein